MDGHGPTRTNTGWRMLSVMLMLAIVIGPLLVTAGCSNKDVSEATTDIISNATSVVLAIKATAPVGSPLVAKIESWVNQAAKFQNDYLAATTPGEQVQLLPVLVGLTETFEADILPLLHTSPAVGVAIAAIDAGLRIVANHFKSAASSPAATSVAGRRAARGVDIEGSKARLAQFLATPKVKAPKQ